MPMLPRAETVMLKRYLGLMVSFFIGWLTCPGFDLEIGYIIP